MAASTPNIVEFIPQLRRYAFALTYDPDEAEDLVQESLARAIAKRPRWKKIKRPRAYLFSILHNLYIDKRKKEGAQSDRMKLNNIDDAHETPIDPTVAYDICQALQLIPPNQREVVLSVGVEGYSYNETAATLGVPVGTVMSRLSRGRHALREHLCAT